MKRTFFIAVTWLALAAPAAACDLAALFAAPDYGLSLRASRSRAFVVAPGVGRLFAPTYPQAVVVQPFLVRRPILIQRGRRLIVQPRSLFGRRLRILIR